MLDKEKPILLRGHKDTVVYGSFAINNSNRVVTASNDGDINIWDLRNPANPLVIRNSNEKSIYSIFDPTDSNKILTLNSSGKIKIYVVGGKQLVVRTWNEISRCLDSNEVKQNNLEDTDIQDLLYKKFGINIQENNNYRPHCQGSTKNENESRNFS